jgi:hypothetical protein
MPNSLGLSIAFLFFLLIPGIAALKMGHRSSAQLDDLSRIDKLSFAVMAGGISLLTTLYLLNFDCWNQNIMYTLTHPFSIDVSNWENQSAWCSGGSAIKIQTLESLPLFVMGGMVGFQTLLSGIAGYLLGLSWNRYSDGPVRRQKDIEQPWEHASRKTTREKDMATVITTSGEEIEGTVHRIGAPSKDYDVLLKGPKKVYRDEINDEKKDTRRLGVFSYHHYRDISQIHFPDMAEKEDKQAFPKELEQDRDSVDRFKSIPDDDETEGDDTEGNGNNMECESENQE